MINYNGKKYKIKVTNKVLFGLEKQFGLSCFEVLSQIEQGKSMEKTLYLVWLSMVEIEDSFDEFTENYDISNLADDFTLVAKELASMFEKKKKQ